jgi:15-cis-phytoene synthase
MDTLSRHSQKSLKQGSQSFAAASRLFDQRTRDSVSLLYSWCRYCDDMIDGQKLGLTQCELDMTAPRQRLEHLRVLTEAAYSNQTIADPAFQALQRVVHRHGIPKRYPLDLLEGFRMDVDSASYDTLEDTLRYSYHVAGVVGIMMAIIMGVRDPATLDRACDLGLGFQLTNIARDVREDALNGRCYLPALWLREENLRMEELARAERAPAVAKLTHRLVTKAEPYYASAMIGIQQLPFRSAWAITVARNVYREIGMQIRRDGEQALKRRVVTTSTRKGVVASRAAFQALYAVKLGRFLPDPGRTDLWSRDP